MSPTLLAKLNAATLALFYSVLPVAELKDTGDPAKWARDKRWIARGASPLSQDGPIKFQFEGVCPWAEEPCRDSISPDVQATVLMWGSGMTKTMGVFFNVLGYVVDEMPAHVLWALKTQDQMDEISKKTLAPEIAANPCLSTKFVTPKSRDSGNTISGKLFASGSLSMIGTESITGFRANRSPVVIADEVDSWVGEVKTDAGEGEGDPLWLMLRRSDGFPRSIRLIASTPGTKGQSRIEHWYQQSDRRKWFIPCRDCGAEQLILWAQVKWEGDCKGARWHCEICGCPHTDEERRHAVSLGKWKPTAPFHGIRGYWINGLNSLLPPNKGFRDRLHQWAQEVTDISRATEPKKAKKVIVQTLFTETWQDDEDAKPEWKEIADRREVWKALPNGIVWLTAGVDVHPDRLEATVEGWGRSEECWTLEHHVLSGDPREPEVWGRLEAALYGPRTRQDGCTPRLIAVGVDTGHPPTQRQAYAFIRPRQSKNWFALKGSSQVEAPIIVRPKKSSTVDRVKLLTVGTNRVKGLIYDRSAIVPPKEPGSQIMPGTMHFHRDLSDVYFQQLLSEDSFPVFKNGVRLREFKKPTQSTRNEALDCKAYSYAALVALGPLAPDAENARLLAEKAERDRVAAGQPEEPEERPVQHNGFVNSGRWRI